MKNNLVWRWLGCFVIAALVFIVQTETSAQSFTDIPSNHPYQEIIYDMQERGYINGYPDGSFKPNAKISRKHVSHLLNKALELEPKTDAVIRYKDVPTNHPYYDDILKVSQAGIFSGDPSGNFKPDAPLTRMQMAKVLDLAFDLNITTNKHFPDVSKTWGFLHVQALYSNGITTGVRGNYKPYEPVTRAHYAVFLHRALNVPKASNPENGTQLTKDEILNLVYRIPFEVELRIVHHKYQETPFDKARKDILEFATEPLTDSHLMNYYEEMCTYCDISLFPLSATDYRFEVVENRPNLVHIRTVSFEGILAEAFFIDYIFEKQAGQWKLSEYNPRNLGAGSFNLTIEEALNIVKNDYALYETAPVYVSYVHVKYGYVYDWHTDTQYWRKGYRLYVKTEDRGFHVIFYPHNGLYNEE